MDIQLILAEASLTEQWHPTKNAELDISNVKLSHIVWWLGKCGHEWQAKVTNRVNGSGCLYCSNQKVLAGYNDLATTHPELAKEWHPTLNAPVLSTSVISGSEKKAWWLGQCGHEWEAVLHTRAGRAIGCPYCSGVKTLKGFNDLVTTHPELAKEWHPVLNGNVAPDMVSAGSNKKVWWLGKCGHEWDTPVARRAATDSGCVYCSNQKVLSGYNDLATTHPELLKEWHPTLNVGIIPTQIIAGTGKKIWWQCELGHAWKTAGANRANHQGSGCPTCSGNRTLAGFNDLAHKFPELAKEWHPTLNGDVTSDKVSAGSSKRAWWLGQCGHEWEANISNRASKLAGCPHCVYHVSKAETELYDYLISLGIGDIKQSTRALIAPYEVDIYVPSKNIAIEYNGLYWHSEEMGKDKFYHSNKRTLCNEQGVQLIQIWEDDWKRDSGLIKQMLSHKFGASNQVRVFARKTKVESVPIEVARKFLTENHLQGFRASSAYYGLVDSNLGLVSLLTVLVKGSVMEIARFASSATVVGGFSKLLKHALKNHDGIGEVHSYSHNDHATGDVYAVNGFVKKHDGQPGYSYVVNGVRVHRLSFTKAKFKSNPELKFVDGLSERELAVLNGLTRVWDSGSSLWVLTL